MTGPLPWTKTLNAKLGSVAFVLLVFSATLVAGNTFILAAMRGDSRKMNLFAAGATYDYRLLFNAERLAFQGGDPAARSQSEAALRETIAAMDSRFRTLLRGDRSQGIPAVDEPSIRAGLAHAAELWQNDRKPRLERFLAATPQERVASVADLRDPLSTDAQEFIAAARDEQEYLQAEVDHAHVLQFAYFAAAIVVLAFAVLLMRSVSARARGLADTADRIASGELSLTAPVSGMDELTVLGEAFNTMTRNLRRLIETEREAADKNQQHLWLIKSLADLGHAMSGNPSVKELSHGVIGYLCHVLDAQVGALYAVENGVGTLRLTGTYAVSDESGVRPSWKVGEGLVGQAALEKRRILVSQAPGDDGMRVRSGLAEGIPKQLVVVPLVYESELRGVIEIGSFSGLSARQLELLDRGASSVGLAISAAEMRGRLQQLLEESQAQAEELTSQQEELRSVNERLEEQTRTLELQKESLLATETVLRQKAAELERTSTYKSEFLANMSHELRTPLNSSLILSKLLIGNKDGNLTPEQVKYAQSIYSAGNDLLALINDILDLSKIEAGKVELNVEAVKIERLVADLRQRFEPLTADKDLAFAIAVEPGCPEIIETDLQRAQQILTNLLSNAVKFTERGSIRLSAGPDGPGRVGFRVEDTGIGIPAEQHEVIFEAFRQADGTTNRKFGGTGLGLSISRELAALLGGEIRLRSQPGEGSAFTLLIPVRDEAKPPAPRAPSPRRQPRPADAAPAADPPATAGPLVEDDRHAISDPRRVVLVIEDEPAFAQIVRDLARELRFQCVVARAADEGLRLAREYRPMAIVLDIGLPDQSGLTVLEILKRDPATRHVPIHVVSVHDHRQRAREMGAVGYVLKPVAREELASAFHALEARLARTMKSVLVVEDDGVQRHAIVNLLAADNVRVVAVATATEALDELRSKSFDCVVLDLMLPDVSGLELLDRMSEDEGCSFPPVIVYTARMLSQDEEQRLRRHSKSIIIKGARSPERLLEEVTLFLHQVESDLPADKQRMLRAARDRESVFDGRRVLLVEDDIRNIFALTSALEPKGMAVDVARNGKEALARLAETPAVDLVLMDIMMPEMDGLSAIRGIRTGANHSMAAVPIIALTAKVMPDDRHQCLAAGANDYIAKPIEVDTLLSLLRVWMPRA